MVIRELTTITTTSPNGSHLGSARHLDSLDIYSVYFRSLVVPLLAHILSFPPGTFNQFTQDSLTPFLTYAQGAEEIVERKLGA